MSRHILDQSRTRTYPSARNRAFIAIERSRRAAASFFRVRGAPVGAGRTQAFARIERRFSGQR
jgi:hypothetical protein